MCREPPLACAAGVTGADLKKRVESIMANRFVRGLSFGKKALLAVAGFELPRIDPEALTSAGRRYARKKCSLVITLAGPSTASGSGVFRLLTRSR